jgi:hypothetical protein
MEQLGAIFSVMAHFEKHHEDGKERSFNLATDMPSLVT